MAENTLFWRTLRSLRQNIIIWIVLFFSTGIKGLVNTVEQPFARSLVVCDEPLLDDAYTGSQWCGDRLTVIQEGMHLSAVGQGQENFAMLCSLTFVIIVTGIWGPKISLELGLIGVSVSEMLFVIASTSPQLGRSLFAMGQGLQGLYPIEYLQGILMLHIGMLPDSDGEANWQVMSYMGIGSGLFWQFTLGNGVQMLALTNYWFVWVVVLVLNITILLLTIFGFPEMRALGQFTTDGKSPFLKVAHEVWSYRDLAFDWRARRYLAKQFFECIAGAYFPTIVPGALMAYHGWSQETLVFVFLFPELVKLVAIPYYDKLLIARFGRAKTYSWTIRYFISGQIIFAWMLCYTDKVAWIWFYSIALLGGFFPLKGYVDSRFAEPEQMIRFQSVQWVMGYFLGTWAGPMFSSRFNAFGKTMGERCMPAIIFSFWVILLAWSVFWLLFDMGDGINGFEMTLRFLDDGDKKGKELWWLVAHDGGASEHGVINEEKWHNYNLQAFFGKSIWEFGGDIYWMDHWMFCLGSMNQTPKQGAILMKLLDAAIDHAKSLHAAHVANLAAAAAAQPEYPELEGMWVADRPSEWDRPEECKHPKTFEEWNRVGECSFANGDWEGGTLKVVFKNGNEYYFFYKMTWGPGAGAEGGPLMMRLHEDGSRTTDQPKRYLIRKKESAAQVQDEPSTTKMPSAKPAEQAPGADPPDGGKPAIEGKKEV